jgi:signal transduction histidine kinase
MASVSEPDTTDGRIRFAPSILRRLGEELNPNVDQGLLELVKNAYDADATECHVWLDGDTNTDVVIVSDDGDGMDAEDIRSGWLVLGDSRKSTSETTRRLKRVPAGNKGLGRLAALRLGHEAKMISRPGDGSQYEVTLDWDEFDKATTVDEVHVEITKSVAEQGGTGTRIELRRLRHGIGRVAARSLARALVLLADPFGDQPGGFSPVLHSEEYSDLAEQVSKRYFDQAEFHLRAEVRNGIASAEVSDWQGRVLWRLDGEQLSQKAGAAYGCPDASLDFWVFILDQRVFTGRNVQLSAVREWLTQFGGVHVYVNGLRVAPYGNPGNDWLDINLRRAQSPENRPSTNTSIGRLRVADTTGSMVQKTDRSGFIDSPAFAELSRFASDSLEWMARQRQQTAERRRQQDRERAKDAASAESEALQAQIANLEDEPAKKQLTSAFERYDRARDREADTLRKELQLYRTLSTAGITAATFAHESNGSPLKVISIVTGTLRRSLARDLPELYETKYEKQIRTIGAAVSELGVLSTATLDLISESKRRVGKVPLNQVIRNVVEIFAPFLEGRKVQLELEFESDGEPYLRGSEAAVESIVTNLINNSLTAFERSETANRKILIRTRIVDNSWQMQVADNGPGIVGISIRDIWLPGQTLRPGGTGLGLTIVRDTLVDLGGTADAVAHGELGGATFTIRLLILGVDHA